MKKEFCLIRRNINNANDGVGFEVLLSAQTEMGYNLEACGMSANSEQAWAILSKPAEEQPKGFDALDAARRIADMCCQRMSCVGCPLDKGAGCLASAGKDKGVPACWVITREG